MTGRLPVGVVLQIAARNLLAHKVKSAVVAAIILVGTALVVVGSALLDSVNASMAESITGSLAGDIQIYSEDAKDKLALFGGMMMGSPDVGVIEDFSTVKTGLADIDDIETIVPMGIDGSITYGGNYVDRLLVSLRGAVKDGDSARISKLKAHIRKIVGDLYNGLDRLKLIGDEELAEGEAVQDLTRASSDAFWQEFDAQPLDALEFLENRVAPLALDANMIYLRYLGTDLDLFAKSFKRFRLVEGEMVPPGQRGFLFNHFFYEDRIKLRIAHRLDQIRDARRDEGETIATSPELAEKVKLNVSHHREIVVQLDPTETTELEAGLRKLLGDTVAADADLTSLIEAFLDMDDGNFDERYAFFYDVIAPRVQLYRVPVGSVLTLTAFTRSGYVKSVNVPVYGVFEFESLEKSGLAGFHNLMDLMTFRDLYGYRTESDRDEIDAIKKQFGVKEVDRENAEDELFGGSGDGDDGGEDEDNDALVETAKDERFDEFQGVELTSRQHYDDALFARTYSQKEIDGGVVLNAAIILKDRDRLDATMDAIRRTSKERHLGVQAVGWQSAAGLVGQFITVIQLVLYVAIFIIFTVAIVIINNSLVMATMERVREIGTLRAIGAGRGLILWMLAAETGVLATVFGVLGLLVGGGIVLILGSVGIPATTDILHFLFAGPRLYPFLRLSHVLMAFVVMFIVTGASTFYPAWLATRITPLEAMQKED